MVSQKQTGACVCVCVCVCVKMGADSLHLKYTAGKAEADWCVQLHPTDSKSGKPQGGIVEQINFS